MDEQRKTVSGLYETFEKLEPPSDMVTVHGNLVRSRKRGLDLADQFSSAIRIGDMGRIATILSQFETEDEHAREVQTAAMKMAGYASPDDVLRDLGLPKRPMPWFWALALLGIVLFLGVGLLGMAIGTLILAVAAPLFIAGQSAVDRRFSVLGRALQTSAAAWCIFGTSVVGVAFAALADSFAFPRTELSGWFVYITLGWVALGFATGSRDESDPQSSNAATMGCVMSVFCLLAYIWAAIDPGSLTQPWQWCYQLIRGCLPGG